MPQCLKCGAELPVDEEGYAPVLCDRCAGRATTRARRTISTGTMRDYPATTALLAINLAVYLAMVFTGAGFPAFHGRGLIQWGANFGPLTVGGEYWRLVTAGFVHGDILHILFNMWCLWSLGRLSERLFGKWQTFGIYLVTGVGGALLSIAYDPGRLESGASGAIFGIAGALLAGVKFGDLSLSAGERRSVISSLTFFVAVNFALGTGLGDNLFGGGGTIDNMCHLGGFVSGLLIGLPLGAFARQHKLLQLGTLLVTALILSAAGRELVQKYGTEGLAARVNTALREHDYSKALRLLNTYIAARPNDAGAHELLGALYEQSGQRDQAIAAYERALQLDPNMADARNALENLRKRP